MNIFDKRPNQSYRTGGIVDVAKPESVIQTGGKRNTYDITAKGPQLTVVLNGAKVVDVKKDTERVDGPIALRVRRRHREVPERADQKDIVAWNITASLVDR